LEPPRIWGCRGRANTRQQKPFEFDVLEDHATAENQLEHVTKPRSRGKLRPNSEAVPPPESPCYGSSPGKHTVMCLSDTPVAA